MQPQRYLHTATGPYTGRKIALRPHEPTTIGRNEEANYAFFSDTFMSRVHASVTLTPTGATVRDLGSTNGVFIKEERIAKHAFLQPGQQLRIGETVFLLSESPIPVRDILKMPPLNAKQSALMQAALAGPLYAILDAAQSDRIVPLLQDGHVNYQSLYEGAAGEQMGNIAPFLVKFDGPCPLLGTVIAEGWDKNWSIFFHCDLGVTVVRRHLRYFLTVETEAGKKLLFRYYDPRILEVFLPTCDQAQIDEFYGPIAAFLTQTAGDWQIHKRPEGGMTGLGAPGSQDVSNTESADGGAWSSPSPRETPADQGDPDRTWVHRSRGHQ